MNILKKSHQWILDNTDNFECAIDMTTGNGHDTEFLASHFKEVVALDIQSTAIQTTQERLQSFSNIKYHNIDHSQYVFNQKFNGAIYNLGYLPGSDKSIQTNKTSTITSLNNLYPNLTDFLVVVCYVGHPGGQIEADAVLEWIESKSRNPTIYKYEGKEKSPIAYCIKL